jgi:hypothetical protein
MLGRNSSNRLSRRKSTSSVHSKHESMDLGVARHHAQTAATLAFARAQERNSTDLGHRANRLSRNNTTSSHQDTTPRQSTNASGTGHSLKRQHSVRFVGPDAVQRRQSVGRKHSQIVPKVSTSTLRPIAITTSAPVPAAYRPPSRSSSIGKASVSKETADNFHAALAIYNEYYTREDDVASTPSSYRRIRKSKSMFSPLTAPNIFYTNGTPKAVDTDGKNCKASGTISEGLQNEPHGVALRAPKSMSFLRGGRDHLTPSLRERNDEAVQKARDRFFQQTTEQRLREQPSFLFKSRLQRQAKPFRKSVRSRTDSSTNSYGPPVVSNQAQSPAELGLIEKARKVSQSIRSRLKRAFTRRKEELISVPNQQVDARETHVRKYIGDPETRHTSFENIPYPNLATLSSVASRPPSLHGTNSNQQLRSHAGSIRSLKSNQSNDNSRVSSWTTTGPINSLTSHGARLQAERELQRLSIINENGTHVSTSSFKKQINNQCYAYPQMHQHSKISGRHPASELGPVDSARVYSALMKRLDENSPRAKLEASRKASIRSIHAPEQRPLRSSSVHSSRSNQTPATIRHVQSSNSSGNVSVKTDHHWPRANSLHSARAEDIFGYTGEHVHLWVAADHLCAARVRDQDDVFSPTKDYDTLSKHELSSEAERIQRSLSQEDSTKTSYHTVPESFGMTPQELAFQNEPVIQGPRAIRESRSTFFGGASYTIGRTTSPFRRALAEADYSPSTVSKEIPESIQGIPLLNPLYSHAQSGADQVLGVRNDEENEKAYSESIYSRSTGGRTPGAANSVLSLSGTLEESYAVPIRGSGDVLILDRATYAPQKISSSSHRTASSASSTEWKTWMSSEVAKLERPKEHPSPFTSYVNYALPTLPRSLNARHVRESAQINDDDIEASQRVASIPKQPLEVLEHKSNIKNVRKISRQTPPILKPILKNTSSVSLVENLHIADFNFPLVPGPPPPPPPPLPVRSPLRTLPSKASLQSMDTGNSIRANSAPNSSAKVSNVDGKILLHKRNASSTTLISIKSVDNANSANKLVKRRQLHNVTSRPNSVGIVGASPASKIGRGRKVNRENDSPHHSPEPKDGIYGTDGAGLMGPSPGSMKLDAQQMGSKRMVDMFLNSRRRRITGESEESGTSRMFL